jgi:hypothetical protein
MAVSTIANVKVDEVSGVLTAKWTCDAASTASSVFCGFTPRMVTLHAASAPGVTALVWWNENMAAGTNGVTTAAGVTTINGANGITALTGAESPTPAAATGSPLLAGPGFTVGTAAQTASLVYILTAYR